MIKKCENCNKNFKTSRYYTQKRFCSNSCRGKWQFKHGNNLPPIQIGLVPWNKGLTKATDDRIKKMSIDRTGDKNWMWKDGVTQRFRDKHKRELRTWREKVFKRDGWTCQDCKKVGGKLHPHHIKGLAKYPELALKVKNGITLCIPCHRLRHREV